MGLLVGVPLIRQGLPGELGGVIVEVGLAAVIRFAWRGCSDPRNRFSARRGAGSQVPHHVARGPASDRGRGVPVAGTEDSFGG
jgi:hypothetical protein